MPMRSPFGPVTSLRKCSRDDAFLAAAIHSLPRENQGIDVSWQHHQPRVNAPLCHGVAASLLGHAHRFSDRLPHSGQHGIRAPGSGPGRFTESCQHLLVGDI